MHQKELAHVHEKNTLLLSGKGSQKSLNGKEIVAPHRRGEDKLLVHNMSLVMLSFSLNVCILTIDQFMIGKKSFNEETINSREVNVCALDCNQLQTGSDI